MSSIDTEARIRTLWDAWQAEIRVPGSYCTDAYHALEEELFEALPVLLDGFEALLDCRQALAAMRSMALCGELYSLQMQELVDGAFARFNAVRSGT